MEGALLAMAGRIGVPLAANVMLIAVSSALFIIDESYMAMALIALLIFAIGPFIASRPIYWLVLAAMTIRLVTSEILRLQSLGTDIQPLSSSIPFVIVGAVISILLRIYRVRVYHFIESARAANDDIAAVNRVSASLERYTEQAELITIIPQLVHEQMGFYHVRLYLPDSTANEARLASTAAEQPAQPPDSSLPITTTP